MINHIDTETFSSYLKTLPACQRFLVAYSGGMDSHVLLHLIASVKPKFAWKLEAVHVNHHLHEESRAWARHCRDTCRSLKVELKVIDVDASRPGRESPESWARQLRYDALKRILGEGEILLTAHHQDDQVETFLLRLFRGAGVLGLTSMPAFRKLGKGWQARPLLSYPRSALSVYAGNNDLNWVEDPSNADPRVDRNFVRHKVIPVIKNKWPELASPVARSIRIHAETQLLLDEVAREDLSRCATEKTNILAIEGLKLLPVGKQKNVLRYWIRTLNLPIPGSKHLSHIISDILDSKYDSKACVKWKGAEARRYGNHLYLIASMGDFDDSIVTAWDFMEPCKLQYGELTAVQGRGSGLKKESCVDAVVEVRYRRGGEEILLPGRAHHHKIKNLFQEAGVPSWLRERVPFIYIDNKLAMVVGLWVDAGALAAEDEDAWIISWSRADELLFSRKS